MIRLVWHSIRMHLVLSISITLTVALAMAAAASFALIYRGTEQGRSLAIERGGAQYLVIPADSETLVSDEDLLFTGAPATMYLPLIAFEKARYLTGVERATFQFYSQTLDSGCCSALHPTRLIGIDPETDFVVLPLLPEQGDLATMLQEGHIIIGSSVDGFESGSGSVLGIPQEVSAVLTETGTELDHSIIVSVEVARALSESIEGYEHFWDRYGEPDTLVSTILVDFSDEYRETALARLQSLGKVKVIERSVIVDQSASQLSSMLAVLAGAGIIMMIASFLQLLARFYSMVWDRRAEFALYEALGASRNTIMRLVSLEAGLLLAAGLLVGILLSLVLFPTLLALATGSGGSFPFVTPSFPEATLLYIGLILVFLLLSFLSILVSLSRIARIDPSLAMRQTDIG